MNSLGIHIWAGFGRGRRRGLVDAKLVQKVVDRLVRLCIAMGVMLMTRDGGVHRGWWLAELKSVSLLGHVSLPTTGDDVDPTLPYLFAVRRLEQARCVQRAWKAESASRG